jgi:serine/threonine protein kinase
MPHLARGHLGQRSFIGKNGVTDEARVIDIVRALLSAIEYAHSCGVIHRDVKAENVLFDDSGRPLLADFGIALRRGFGPRVTAAGLCRRQHRLHGTRAGTWRGRRRARRSLQPGRADLGNAHRTPALPGRRCTLDGGDARPGPDPETTGFASPLAALHESRAGQGSAQSFPERRAICATQ